MAVWYFTPAGIGLPHQNSDFESRSRFTSPKKRFGKFTLTVFFYFFKFFSLACWWFPGSQFVILTNPYSVRRVRWFGCQRTSRPVHTDTPGISHAMTDVIDLTVPEQAHFTVPGNPVSQPRSRFYNGGVANIRSKERKNFIEVVKHQMAVNPGNHWLPISIGVPVQLRVEFYVKTPAGSQTKSKKKNAMFTPVLILTIWLNL